MALLAQAAALAVLFVLGLAVGNWGSWLALVAIAVVYAAAGEPIRLGRHWLCRLEWSLGFGWCGITAVFLGADRGETNAAELVAIPMTMFPYGIGIGFATWLLIETAVLVSRLRRPRQGSCPWCGYDLAGLGDGAACPECGKHQ